MFEVFNKKTHYVTTISGVEFHIHPSFWILAAPVALLSLLAKSPLVFLGFLTVFGFVFLHEWGHILAARYFGYTSSRLTLSAIGGLAIINGLGKNPREVIYIALAGPGVNAVLAIFGLLLAAIFGWNPYFYFLVNINWILMIFNLVPAYPLDGGRVLQGIIWNWFGYVRSHQWTPVVTGFTAGLILVWSILNFNITGAIIAIFVLSEAKRHSKTFRKILEQFTSEEVDLLMSYRGELPPEKQLI